VPALEHRVGASYAVGLLQQNRYGGFVRDGCGAETYARHLGRQAIVPGDEAPE